MLYLQKLVKNCMLLSIVTKLLRNAPGGGKIPLFRRAGAEN
jgi:hypothetical protein